MKAMDYQLSPDHAMELAGLALLPRDTRLEGIRRFVRVFPAADLAELVADLIGMANSVAENCQQLLKDEAVAQGLVHPHSTERINFPSMHGALMGVSLAAGIDAIKVCGGCAFRLGSIANQCTPTQYDAGESVDGERVFNCHEDLDAKGNPTHACRGFAQAVKQAERKPFIGGQQ